MAFRKIESLGSSFEEITPVERDASCTAVELWAQEILWQASAFSPRSLQAEIGFSELTYHCERALAYKLQCNTPPLGTETALKAFIGTGYHMLIAERIEQLFGKTGRYLVETPVSYRGVIGTADLFDTLTGRVIDWKSAGYWKMNSLRKNPEWSYNHLVQLSGYGAALDALGWNVKEICTVFVPRDGNTEDVIALVRPFDRSIADEAIDKIDAIRGLDPATVDPSPGVDCIQCQFYNPGYTGDLSIYCPGSDALALAQEEQRSERSQRLPKNKASRGRER